ncbi:HNH endonuclease signature motif containing protein [Mesorhizobium carmichaelinearum]|uniref:HNH endonuclease signature motif containing protein n=1 Tax=Mesorhizobium carmichaelinearum TaxID=1208188 RepID=UPI0015C8A039|nr:HNH endonuclease signature motif containing protein [Mesorhizobium carmichaelinearum]
MVHVIPLSIAQRRLDTGNAPQYPQRSPIGGAMQGFGDHLSVAAERYQQMKDQQEAFDAEIARRRFDAQIAQAEDEVTANAPADGAGLHEAMYGQVDPYSGRVAKTGLFDKLFAAALPNMPESQRAAFASQKEAMRAGGARRMAQRQLQRRDDYESAEWTKVDTMSTNAIAQSDPNDTANFEAIRQSGSDLIAKIGNPLVRQAAEAAWRTNTTKALVQAMIAQDPKRAAEMLGSVQGRTKDDAVVGGSSASDSANAAAKGDRVGTRTPDEAVSQAFGGGASTTPDDKTAIPLDAITYLKPGDVAALKDQANSATAAQLIGAHARVLLAEQNAPAVIAATGKYPEEEEEPTAQDFVNIYGAEEGSKHFDQFRTTASVAKSFFDMYRVPNQAIHAELRDFEPGPDGSPEERERYEVRAGAAQLILGARDADPVAYIGQIFPDKAPDWSKVSTPQDFQTAVTWAWAAQQQMGFGKVLAVPQALSDSFGARYVDESVPLQQRIIELSEFLKAVRDPEARFTFAGQVFQSALARLRQNAANNPKITPAELEAQGKALEAGLIEMALHPARVRFNAGSWWQKPVAAVNDSVRLVANGATFDQADKFAAGMNWLFSDKSYNELLAAQQAESEDAEDRAGSAGTAAKLLGAFATGHGLQSAGLTFMGKFGAEALEGLPGLFARSAGMAADGAVFGGVDAALNGRDIVREMGAGALLGAGGNVLAEGLSAIGGRIAARLANRYADPTSTDGVVSSQTPRVSVEDAGASNQKAADPAVDLDSENIETGAFSLIHPGRYKTNKTLRREWELKYGRPWPKDADTGRNMDVSHEIPLADGGPDHISNIQPRSRVDHIKRHMDAGDYERWSRQWRQTQGGS